jgi:hypothetical protein
MALTIDEAALIDGFMLVGCLKRKQSDWRSVY